MVDKICNQEAAILKKNVKTGLERMNKKMSDMSILVSNVGLDTTELIRMGNMEDLKIIGDKI
jgi:hypothetical protein